MAKYKVSTTDSVSYNETTGKLNQVISSTTSSTETKYDRGTVIGGIVMVLLLIGVLFTLLGKEQIGIGWLLETLQGVPKIDMSWINNFINFKAPTLYVPLLKIDLLGWLNPLVNVIKALLFVCTAIVQAAIFLVYLLGALFF